MTDSRSPSPSTRHTLGSIITWALVRTVVVIFLALWLHDYVRWLQYEVWWGIVVATIVAAVIYPAQIQYRIYREETHEVVTNTLCSSCRHFEPTAVMCSRYDEHVTEGYLPCDGMDWEPLSVEEKGGSES